MDTRTRVRARVQACGALAVLPGEIVDSDRPGGSRVPVPFSVQYSRSAPADAARIPPLENHGYVGIRAL